MILILGTILGISLLGTFAGLLSGFGWEFDLLSHFHLQYFFIQAAALPILFIRKKKTAIIGLTILAFIINVYCVLPVCLPSSQHQESEDAPQLSIVLFNLNSANNRYAEVSEYLQRAKPDVLALEELNEQWVYALQETLKAYPYREFVARDDNFGIGLFSKVEPVAPLQTVYFTSLKVPSILARYHIGEKDVDLLFTHPVPPINREYYEWRNEQLQAISRTRKELVETLIVVGDLNTTSWSSAFDEFSRKMHLTDSRYGFGLEISWPTMYPILLGVTIDHILISPDIKVAEHSIGPDLGSDHFPVYVKLQF